MNKIINLFIAIFLFPTLAFSQPQPTTFILTVSDDTSTLYTTHLGFEGADVSKLGYKGIVTVHASFLSTDIDTSAELATILTDETGSGALVFGTSPTFTTDITFPALSIEAGAYGAATIDGDDINSNLAGRSLTLTAASPDTLDADAELYTVRFNLGWENPVAADDDIIQCEPAGAFTITEIACSTDTGTATINFNENVNTTPNTAGTAILSADIVCDTNRQSSCASGCDVNTISNAGIAAGNLISMVVTSVASTPTKLRIHLKGTYDD